MPNHWRQVLCAAATALLCSQATLAATTLEAEAPSSLLNLIKKSVIDKSCIMMCDEWGDSGCKKWVMRCKGDPGYPKALNLAQ